jgi:L-ascorbate metabolism protein UlaG (beta-lactamase superfamily)
MFKQFPCSLVLFVLTIGIAYALPTDATNTAARAQYLANEGLMVVHGDTKVLFDPLFRNSYGHYKLLPRQMREALFNGEPPFDGVDAVFVSHYHGDHFSPEDILHLLNAQPGIRLFAPSQAVTALHKVAVLQDLAVFERVTAISLAYKQAPVRMEMEGLVIEAVRIPHSGWPTSRLEVENISWRVTLNETTTVLHLGDADANDVHFERDASYWDEKHPHMAFPPYWFFVSAGGLEVLENRLRPMQSVGVHVPNSISADPALRPKELQGHDLFVVPGETRDIPGSDTKQSKE